MLAHPLFVSRSARLLDVSLCSGQGNDFAVRIAEPALALTYALGPCAAFLCLHPGIPLFREGKRPLARK
jgi:hypothetical protein